MSFYERERFDAVIPVAESAPAQLVRQAIYRWRVARHDADAARAIASASADARLARCAAQRDRDREAMAGLVGGAAAAWTGRDAGTLFVCYDEGWPGWLRVDWAEGRAAMVADVRPGREGAPSGNDEVFDLVGLEDLLSRAAIDAAVPEEAVRLRAHAIRDEAAAEDRRHNESKHHLGAGFHTLGSLVSTFVGMAEFQLKRQGARVDPEVPAR